MNLAIYAYTYFTKEVFKSGMKERVGDGKLIIIIIISMTIKSRCRVHDMIV